ncbi:hypothetical protein Hamer_G021335 [Homarus americanus]|uniref:Uncharacterized protein n=1 Tax=Homarus americanus TaxID=6706 RepID=A0A8J5MLZ5_HOMAM|nr:hypothetical protein Hamer_G021335 [Homarus americanus]
MVLHGVVAGNYDLPLSPPVSLSSLLHLLPYSVTHEGPATAQSAGEPAEEDVGGMVCEPRCISLLHRKVSLTMMSSSSSLELFTYSGSDTSSLPG